MRHGLAAVGGGLRRAADARPVRGVDRHEREDAGREEGDDAGGEGKGNAQRAGEVLDPALGKHVINDSSGIRYGRWAGLWLDAAGFNLRYLAPALAVVCVVVAAARR